LGGEAEQITNVNLRSQVAKNIRTRIIAGVLESDTIYSSADIAHGLGVSITPVREAILDLSRAGLVEVVRNRGFRVVSMTGAVLDQVAEVRQMLEPSSMRLIVLRASDEDLAKLSPMIDELGILADNDISSFMVADYNFHIALFSLCGNERLLRIIIDLCDQTRLKLVGPRRNGATLTSVVDTYRRIQEALVARDADRATGLMQRHVEDIRGVWAGD
jgi:DNA-binding GntR family transcriptional regulator